MSGFALRWWGRHPLSITAALAALAGAALAWRWPETGLATAVIVAVGPPGLGLRGRTAALAWTRRAGTLAAVTLVLVIAAVAVGVLTGVGPLAAAATAMAVPLLTDAACAVTGPSRPWWPAPTSAGPVNAFGGSPHRRGHHRFVREDEHQGYVAYLVAGTNRVVASPASFNNRAGLARAVNENLADGTEVFVAEMGTYGPGEIADLCSWLVPDIAVITAIGPVTSSGSGARTASCRPRPRPWPPPLSWS